MGRFIAELLGLASADRTAEPEIGLSNSDRETLMAAGARARSQLAEEGVLERELEAQGEIQRRYRAA